MGRGIVGRRGHRSRVVGRGGGYADHNLASPMLPRPFRGWFKLRGFKPPILEKNYNLISCVFKGFPYELVTHRGAKSARYALDYR